MVLAPNAKGLLRSGVVLNVKEQDAISVGNSFLSFQTGKGYKIRLKLSCDSKSIIYLASCKRCHLQYIGSSTTDFTVRFRNQKRAMVTEKKICEVAVNFNKTPHDLSDFSFHCIDQVQATVNNSCNIEKPSITKEAYWNAQLFSLAPFGLNKRQEFHLKQNKL